MRLQSETSALQVYIHYTGSSRQVHVQRQVTMATLSQSIMHLTSAASHKSALDWVMKRMVRLWPDTTHTSNRNRCSITYQNYAINFRKTFSQRTISTETLKRIQTMIPLSVSSSVSVVKLQATRKQTETKNVVVKPQISLAITYHRYGKP